MNAIPQCSTTGNVMVNQYWDLFHFILNRQPRVVVMRLKCFSIGCGLNGSGRDLKRDTHCLGRTNLVDRPEIITG